ncbi:MAG: hypothetical protein MR679_03795, partial [Bacteroidales bacterium]|nr:hypothetical protein [Bacteroidales bacterium]
PTDEFFIKGHHRERGQFVAFLFGIFNLSVASRGTIIDEEPGSASLSPRVISLSVIGEGEATGIEEIGIISHTTASGHSGLYDLQGRRLNHEPAHGIYIHNGRKVVR